MQRRWYLDILRIVSMAAVVVIHTAAFYFLRLDPGTPNWLVSEFWDGCMRWAVPVFVMISGALFLDPYKEMSIKKLYTSNIFRVVLIILFWGFVYACVGGIPEVPTWSKMISFVETWLMGHYHMWFLYMIAGLYMVTPLLRAIVRGGGDRIFSLRWVCG